MRAEYRFERITPRWRSGATGSSSVTCNWIRSLTRRHHGGGPQRHRRFRCHRICGQMGNKRFAAISKLFYTRLDPLLQARTNQTVPAQSWDSARRMPLMKWYMSSFERRLEPTEESGHVGQFCPYNVPGYTKVRLMSHILQPTTDHRCSQTKHPLLTFTNWLRANNVERDLRKRIPRCCTL